MVYLRKSHLVVLYLCIAPMQAGCVNVANQAAVCDGSRAARTNHAAALVQDGGPRSLVTGAALIGVIDAGCADQ